MAIGAADALPPPLTDGVGVATPSVAVKRHSSPPPPPIRRNFVAARGLLRPDKNTARRRKNSRTTLAGVIAVGTTAIRSIGHAGKNVGSDNKKTKTQRVQRVAAVNMAAVREKGRRALWLCRLAVVFSDGGGDNPPRNRWPAANCATAAARRGRRFQVARRRRTYRAPQIKRRARNPIRWIRQRRRRR